MGRPGSQIGLTMLSATTSTSPGAPTFRHTRGAGTGIALLLVVAFPYVTPVNTPFDTQPFALMTAFAVILLYTSREGLLRLPGLLLAPFIVALAATISWLANDLSMAGLRSLAGYLTVGLVGGAAYAVSHGLRGRLLLPIVTIWLAVGLVQQFLFPNFGVQFLARMSTSATRGVTALAPEPSLYAISCIFFFLLNDLFLARGAYGSRRYWMTFAAVLVQCFLANSALGFVLFVIYLFARAISTGRVVRVSLGLASTVAIVGVIKWLYATVPSLMQTRVANLLDQASQSLSQVMFGDQSVAQRLFAIQASHESLFYSGGLGYGIGTWKEGVADILAKSDGGLYRYGISEVSLDRVMSGFGSAVYELGIVGLLLPLVFWLAVLRVRAHHGPRSPIGQWSFVSGITLSAVMVSAVPLAFPMYGLIFGILVAESRSTGHARERAADLDASGVRGVA